MHYLHFQWQHLQQDVAPLQIKQLVKNQANQNVVQVNVVQLENVADQVDVVAQVNVVLQQVESKPH